MIQVPRENRFDKDILLKIDILEQLAFVKVSYFNLVHNKSDVILIFLTITTNDESR